MQAPKSHILVLGHSFIRRLQDAINSDSFPNLVTNFGLSQCEVHFVTMGGWTISDYRRFVAQVQSALPRVRFQAAIIQLGGNDLCHVTCRPLELASKMEDFCQWLKNELGIQSIHICDICSRPNPRGVSPSEYEEKRLAVIRYLVEDNLIYVYGNTEGCSTVQTICS